MLACARIPGTDDWETRLVLKHIGRARSISPLRGAVSDSIIGSRTGSPKDTPLPFEKGAGLGVRAASLQPPSS